MARGPWVKDFGDTMTVKLSNNDRCAIDLALQQRTGDEEVPAHCFDKSNATLRKQVTQVERLFDLLGHMPAQDPPDNLLKTTLRHVHRHEHDAVAAPPSASKATLVSHPMSQRALQ